MSDPREQDEQPSENKWHGRPARDDSPTSTLVLDEQPTNATFVAIQTDVVESPARLAWRHCSTPTSDRRSGILVW